MSSAPPTEPTSGGSPASSLAQPVEPITVLCATPSAQLVAGASNTSLFLFDTATSTLLAQSSSSSSSGSPPGQHEHLQRIRLLAATNDKLVSTGDDKLLKVWSLPSLELLSTRSLAKRANTLDITEDAQTIAVGDKFGDVFSFLLDANQELASTGTKEATKEAELDKKESHNADKRQPVLGHVSMLTDLAYYQSPEHGQTVITADRDEHIRISKWPRGLEIVQYLLGHLKFVSALFVDEEQHLLYSAGGEEELYTWDLTTMKLKTKRDISALRQYAQIQPPARRPNVSEKKNKGKKVDTADQGEQGQEQPVPASARDVDPGQPGAETNEEMPLVVNGLHALSDQWLGVTSIGASAIIALHTGDTIRDPAILDLQHPILSLCRLPNHQYLAALDAAHGHSAEQNSPTAVVFSFKDGVFEVQRDAPQAKALSAVASTSSYPAIDILYSDLSLLFKDHNPGESGLGEAMDSTAPRDRKPGKPPANALKAGEKSKKGKSNSKKEKEQHQSDSKRQKTS